MSQLYVLGLAAESDMREVARYTLKQWGAAQTRTYTGKLHQCMTELASGSGLYKELPELYPGLRMTRCQHHYIFMLPRPDAPAGVLGILHERMALMERLRARLPI